MSDAANVYAHEGDRPGVYLYTHWNGPSLPDLVKSAMSSPQGRKRWDDIAYLTRIIFSRMIDGSLLSESGYGISTEVIEADDRIVDVDTQRQVVTLVGFEPPWANTQLSFKRFTDG